MLALGSDPAGGDTPTGSSECPCRGLSAGGACAHAANIATAANKIPDCVHRRVPVVKIRTPTSLEKVAFGAFSDSSFDTLAKGATFASYLGDISISAKSDRLLRRSVLDVHNRVALRASRHLDGDFIVERLA
jgi:hypothetical protein